MTPSGRSFAGWRMVLLSAYIHNCSYGVAFGAFGVSVVAMQERFGTSRATTAFAFSLVTAAIVISAPFLGMLYSRVSIRRSIVLGALLGAAGYACLAMTRESHTMLLIYAILLGPGVALSGSMATSVLVTRWFVERQGLALGIVNLPLGLMIMPLIAVPLLQSGGLTLLYWVLAGLFLTIAIAAWPLVDTPSQISQQPHGIADPSHRDRSPPVVTSLTVRAILMRWDFWILVLAVGVILGGSSMKYAHMVPLLGERGYPIETASKLLALTGGAGAVGSVLFGVLADRMGGSIVLIGTAMVQALMWGVFLIPLDLRLLALDAVIIGMCGGGVTAAQGVFIARRFGTENFSRVLGLLAVTLTPFFVGINPLAGYLRDLTGSYQLPIGLLMLASALASVLLTIVIADERRRAASPKATV